jgi:hypothetical protein
LVRLIEQSRFRSPFKKLRSGDLIRSNDCPVIQAQIGEEFL